MVKLIQLIRQYWNIILFFLLEFICFRLIVNSNNIQGSDLLNSSNAIAGFFYEKQNDVVGYFQLKSANKDLLAENTRLHNELSQLKYTDTLQNVTAKIPIVVFDSVKAPKDTTLLAKADSPAAKPVIVQDLRPYGNPKVVGYASYSYIAARVINNSVVADRNNFITINRGTADGIEKDMAVVSGEGIVGRVAYVSKHYASVISVLSSRNVSTQIAGGNIGITNWSNNSPDFVTMSQVDIRTKVRKGDTAYTTSYSVYPENIPVGVVVSVDTYKVNNSLNLRLRLSNNFRNLKYVYVVKNLLGSEKRDLEKATAAKEKAALEASKKPK
ncbi:hypothetical protein DBR32_11485 [Taibaiella sp. KBW10]|uniref:rod shape-determining protein MreC n=1 Tax=Taibaiella sp. KBW10 TaxID=2153357 RepID=UPI000F5A65E3|nr:rod shape-determining protein MreC [Taibaiella sp. KBW10]RQO30196.1 hypothetical protein DBR32_11485 [Taibaiella sp. KBW10]